ncbi:MAG: L-seryl-tRNA(Sec) selenium transferase [Pirellulales bacterium]
MKSPNLLRKIPSVGDLLESPPLKGLVERVSHNVVVDGVRGFLDEMRTEVQQRASEFRVPPISELAEHIARRILEGEQPGLQPVINATGILLHTGLGRAPLAEEAVKRIAAIARGYSNLEFNLETGQRSQRMAAVEGLLRQVTGAEASLVVNNNAAATLLALTAVAAGREVIVSRGQLVEIGGSFRLPDVMSVSGAILREVGTTNKTHPDDYERAIGEQTAALLRVHTSNYRVVGFTSAVGLEELVRIGRKHDLPVIDDIGSGALVDFSSFGCGGEPLVRSSVTAGASLVLLSGDKLLGGPQCGILLGSKQWIEPVRKHPLARAVRVGKLTLAALEATLRLYRDPAIASRDVPLLRLVDTPLDNLKNRAERLAPQLAACDRIAQAEVCQEVSYLGGGSLPAEGLPTWCVALTPADGALDPLAKALRKGTPAIVGRVQQDRLLLDLRTVFPGQDQQLVEAFEALGGNDHTAQMTIND